MGRDEKLKMLRTHVQRLSGCVTFEAFLAVQLNFLELLILDLEDEEAELIEAARELVREADGQTS
jgi:succinate dehydrogenase/fumarate reductase cytochrome b subunit